MVYNLNIIYVYQSKFDAINGQFIFMKNFQTYCKSDMTWKTHFKQNL